MAFPIIDTTLTAGVLDDGRDRLGVLGDTDDERRHAGMVAHAGRTPGCDGSHTQPGKTTHQYQNVSPQRRQ